MLNSQEFEEDQRLNTEPRYAMIKRWAEYSRTHDDEEWSRQHNRLIDSQLRSAKSISYAHHRGHHIWSPHDLPSLRRKTDVDP